MVSRMHRMGGVAGRPQISMAISRRVAHPRFKFSFLQRLTSLRSLSTQTQYNLPWRARDVMRDYTTTAGGGR